MRFRRRKPRPFGRPALAVVEEIGRPALRRRGIYLFENVDMEGLSRERVYEFLFTWAPLKLVGATGSPGNPIVAW